MSELHPDTVAVHAGHEGLDDLGVHALPIDLSSTNPLPDIARGGESYEALTGGRRPTEGGSNVYGRLWNPTVARFEDALAALEGADEAVAFASGMAAMTAATPVLELSTDPSLIGGLVVQIGDQLYDASVKNRLEQVRKRLIEGKTHEIQKRRDQFSHSA